MKEVANEEIYRKSLNLLRQCLTKYGFKASSEKKNNYSRIWGRDSMVCSLAALMTYENDLILGVKNSLVTLIKYQSKNGQIPSNVDPIKGQVSFGSSAGRVDSTLWFLVGFSQYVKRNNDLKFLEKYYRNFEKALNVLQVFEFNSRNLIYVPIGGDWADEYIQEGYVLYDQLLYLKALEADVFLRKKLGKDYKKSFKKFNNVMCNILINFDVNSRNKSHKCVYHKSLFERALKQGKRDYLLPYFNPAGYGDNFDGFANSLALNLNIFSMDRYRKIIRYVEKISKKNMFPAFNPVIKKGSKEWNRLRDNHLFEFKNKPYEYHNGGIWPVVIGFYISGLVRQGDKKRARKYLEGINYANSLRNFRFSEFLNGKSYEAKGTGSLAWSAAGNIIGFLSVEGEKLFL